MNLENKLIERAAVDALLFYALGAKIDKLNDNSFYGTRSLYISIPEHVSVKISDEILDDIESNIEDINETIKTQNGLFSFIKERMIGIALLYLYDESFDEEDFDEEDMDILKTVFKIYIKTRKGETLDQDMYEKKCNEFCDNFKKNVKKYHLMSEYIEV